MKYENDCFGNPIRITYPDGTEENYEYDFSGNCISKTNAEGETVYNTFDSLGRQVLSRIKNGTEISEFKTYYDFRGNAIKSLDAEGNKTENEYDETGRLKTSRQYSSEVSGIETSYEYDKAGYMTKMSYGGIGESERRVYEYENDLYGRVIKDTDNFGLSNLYEYDSEGNLLKYTDRNGNVTEYVYDGANIAGEMTDGNYYKYYRGTELIGYTSFKGERKYYRQDAHGNVTGLLNADGTEQKSYNYNAYGKEDAFVFHPMGNDTIIYQWKAETEKIHNPFGYCGEYKDEETGLIYLRNRYYDPTNGRFITEDPIKDGVNWYAYCGGNPVMFVDPLGLALQVKFEEEIYKDDEKKYTYEDFTEDETGLLGIITDDILEFDDGGNISAPHELRAKEGDMKLPTGTMLLRFLIDSEETFVIRVSTEHTQIEANEVNDILFNPKLIDKEWVVYDGNSVKLEKRPLFISLAHEMIHIYRRFNFYNLRKMQYNDGRIGTYRYIDNDGNVKVFDTFQDELETVGINYTYINEFGEQQWFISSMLPITENKIRLEQNLANKDNVNSPGHNLGIRVQY